MQDDNQYDEHEDFEIITLNIEDKDIECAVLGVFSIEDKEYIAVMPTSEEAEIIIFGYKEHEEDMELINIDSDEEYEEAYNMFQQILTDAAFGTDELEIDEIDEI
jgi:hypothetical protein